MVKVENIKILKYATMRHTKILKSKALDQV